MSTITLAPAPRARAARPASGGSVRLTRRGRLVVFAVALAALLALGLLFAGMSGASDQSGDPVSSRTVVVGSGETLWDFAAEAVEATDSGESIREMQHRIEELNALESPALMAGQELRIPME